MKNSNFLNIAIVIVVVFCAAVFVAKYNVLSLAKVVPLKSNIKIKCPPDDADWTNFFTPNEGGLIDEDGLTVECQINDAHTLVYEMVQAFAENGKAVPMYKLYLKYGSQQLYLGSSSLYNPGGVVQFTISESPKKLFRIYTVAGDSGGLWENGWFVNADAGKAIKYYANNFGTISIDQDNSEYNITYVEKSNDSLTNPSGSELILQGLKLNNKQIVSFAEPIIVAVPEVREIASYTIPKLSIDSINLSLDRVGVSVATKGVFSISLEEGK